MKADTPIFEFVIRNGAFYYGLQQVMRDASSVHRHQMAREDLWKSVGKEKNFSIIDILGWERGSV